MLRKLGGKRRELQTFFSCTLGISSRVLICICSPANAFLITNPSMNTWVSTTVASKENAMLEPSYSP
jgi:hypothetical protein